MSTPKKPTEDVNVLPNIGLPGGYTAAFVPLEKEFDSVEEPLIKDRGVVILNGDPFILRAFFNAFAAGVDIVDVVADVPRVGEYDADGGGGYCSCA